MASKSALPPAPDDTQLPPPPPPPAPETGSTLNIFGQPPQPNMAPPEETPSGLSENTTAEMEAGKRHLELHVHRDSDEHAAGRKILEQYPDRK